jgi:type IV pilus assembly protein PilW
MVAMAISLIVMGSIYSVYQTQQKSYLVQEQVAAMQQNLRAAMTMLTRDIRMAGYYPIVAGTGNPLEGTNVGITVANNNNIQFTRINDAQNAVETITYNLADNGGDGDMDLFRNVGGGPMLVAENIDALDFVYLDVNDNPITIPIADPSLITAISVSMVARTGRVDIGYVNTDVYNNSQGAAVYPASGNPSNDNHRRMFLTREIKRRN